MAYKTKLDPSADKTIQLGGKDKKTGKPNPTSIEGYYLGFKNIESDFGPGKLHVFQTAEGNVGVWGKTMMDRILTGDHVGQQCLLSFTGFAPAQKGRQPAYKFSLQYDEENTIDTTGIDLNASAASEPEEYADTQYEEETDVDAEEQVLDEVVPTRPVAARTSVAAPKPSHVKQLLGNRNRSTT